MKVQAYKVDGFITSPPANVLGALLYGPDVGQVSERQATLSGAVVDDPDDPFTVVELSIDSVKEDPASLTDALCAMSLTGGRRLVKLRDVGNSHTKLIESALAELPDQLDAFLLVTAGDLSPGSLRTLFEKDDRLAALPCYIEQGRDLEQTIRETANQNSLTLEAGVSELIAARVQGDRLMGRSEVQKLALYAGDTTQISLEMAQQTIGDSSEAQTDELVDVIFAGDTRATITTLHKSLEQGVFPIMILRSLARHIERIHTIVAKGGQIESTIKSLRPPVFFKRVPIVTAHARKFSSPAGEKRLWQLRSLCFEAEREQKTSTGIPDLLLERHLLKAAGLCRGSKG